MIKNLTVEEFIKELSSNNPTPGGGGVAALSAAMAAGLNSMVYSLTINKKAFLGLDEEIRNKVLSSYEESIKSAEEFIQYIEMDKKAFSRLMDCYKMPKDTEEEKNERNKEISIATEEAMIVPFRLMDKARRFYEHIEIALEFGSKNLISDVAVAVIMINASIEASIINVKVNFASLDHNEKITGILEEAENIVKISENKKKKILEKINF